MQLREGKNKRNVMETKPFPRKDWCVVTGSEFRETWPCAEGWWEAPGGSVRIEGGVQRKEIFERIFHFNA